MVYDKVTKTVDGIKIQNKESEVLELFIKNNGVPMSTLRLADRLRMKQSTMLSHISSLNVKLGRIIEHDKIHGYWLVENIEVIGG